MAETCLFLSSSLWLYYYDVSYQYEYDCVSFL